MKALVNLLKTIAKDKFDLEVQPELKLDTERADYATNLALSLAKPVGRVPREVAEELGQALSAAAPAEWELKATVAGPGFLNLSLGQRYWESEWQGIERLIRGKERLEQYTGKTVVVEFSDPNPFKVLHVGHLYTSIVGESISRLIEQAGGRVIRANFGGDVGLHVAKTMRVMLERVEEMDALVPEKRAEFMAECYVEGTRRYEEDEDEAEKIKELNRQLYRVALEGLKDSELAKRYWLGREWSYQYFKDFYKKVGVKFDRYYPESEVAELGLSKVKEGLRKGVYKESDGAVVYKGEKVGLHTRVFINKAGLPTYEAKDVGLIFRKWEDWQFDLSVVITGNDIIDYMKVVLASIREYAPELVKKTRHLTHGNVRLPGNEKMSSRKGNFLKAAEILELVERSLAEQYGRKDEKIAMAAVKYAFLKYKIGGNIIFEPKESVAMNGNSGPYLQYAAVRAKKILAQCEKEGRLENWNEVLDKNWQWQEQEARLVKKIVEFKKVLELATNELAPQKICEYLYELTQEFSRFYEKIKVRGSEFEKERSRLVKTYLEVLILGFSILGIEVPEEM